MVAHDCRRFFLAQPKFWTLLSPTWKLSQRSLAPSLNRRREEEGHKRRYPVRLQQQEEDKSERSNPGQLTESFATSQ
jgi:hypothetical protein